MNVIRNTIVAIVATAAIVVAAPANATNDGTVPDLYTCPADWPTNACVEVNRLLGDSVDAYRVIAEQHDAINALNAQVAADRARLDKKTATIKALRQQLRNADLKPVA